MNQTANSLSIASREELKSRPLAPVEGPITNVTVVRMAQFYHRDAVQESIGASVRALLAGERIKTLPPQRETILRCN